MSYQSTNLKKLRSILILLVLFFIVPTLIKSVPIVHAQYRPCEIETQVRCINAGHTAYECRNRVEYCSEYGYIPSADGCICEATPESGLWQLRPDISAIFPRDSFWNVGIGTDNPQKSLDIFSAYSSASAILRMTSDKWNGINLSRGTASPSEKWFIGMDNTSDNLIFRRGASLNDLTISARADTTAGNVEIAKQIKIFGGNPRLNSILTTADGTGLAVWKTKEELELEATDYTPGAGISITANVISAKTDGITLTTNAAGQLIAKNDQPIWNANELQGKAISATAPTANQVLKWNGTAWEPAPVLPACPTATPYLKYVGSTWICVASVAYTPGAGISISAANVISTNVDDYTIKIASNKLVAQNTNSIWNADKLLGRPLSPTLGDPDAYALTDGQVLTWSTTEGAWVARDPASSGGLPAGTAEGQTLRYDSVRKQWFPSSVITNNNTPGAGVRVTGALTVSDVTTLANRVFITGGGLSVAGGDLVFDGGGTATTVRTLSIGNGITNDKLCLNGHCISSWSETHIPPGTCGNNLIESGEQCDGVALPESCSSLGYLGGALSCSDVCIFDTSLCSPAEKKYVFVTGGTVPNSSMTDGGTQGNIWIIESGIELVGRDAADKICDKLADNAGLPGTYKAWISGETIDGVYQPFDDFSHASVPYVMPGSPVKIVANNWDDLVSGSLVTRIYINERGEEISDAYARVFTGTCTNGKRGSNSSDGSCLNTRGVGDVCGTDWNEISSSGVNHYWTVGYVRQNSSGWTSVYIVNADCSLNNHLYCFQQ